MKLKCTVLYILFVFIPNITGVPFTQGELKCERINVPECLFLADRGYSFNKTEDKTQSENIKKFKIWLNAVDFECSEALTSFLCTEIFPTCDRKQDEVIRPCSSFCRKVESGCKPLYDHEPLSDFKPSWPLNCSQYPNGDDTDCLKYSDVNKQYHKQKEVQGVIEGPEHTNLVIQCAKGYILHITKVSHSDSKCCGLISKYILANICYNKTICKVQNTQSTFGAHCRGTVGTVKVEYKCIKKLTENPLCLRKCFNELEKLKVFTPLGSFAPECSADGWYLPLQCHQGECFCVFTKTGEEVLGTRVKSGKPRTCAMTNCLRMRHQIWTYGQKRSIPKNVYQITSCDKNGKFEQLQCWRGGCWCVDPETGKALTSTSKSRTSCQTKKN
ncbi:uncharacterized protein LOC130647192 [Hydractinia symbiolongicarpus]|uniref:uncharacterized protein LOC130647192 n=1 Tax=Hydractinia symbiolongicarpus TaxID=13093 RepID=UPI002551AA45|nr:uncharacterized protein LOC130647192 [Hydractinia symbiolongicarpus]XP_057308944.1 uncharacterized protein LOC130647192 [Hydractinia symbiolongicarpus]XP_057308945.1 uncharacterized protein LOC130647192 [Hydractinia symbiolongicarpus]